MPQVSVCIPTYNRVRFLKTAIDSVLSQSLQDFELIICDDGSTDGTPEMIAALQDSRVRYIRHAENIGKSNNMRSGFDAAIGEYFIKFDDDDRLTPEFLSKTVTILQGDSSLDFVSTDHWIIDDQNHRDWEKTQQNSQQWGRSTLKAGIIEDLLATIFMRQSVQIGATLFRRQALLDVGFMRPNLQNCEDNDLLVRLALAGKKGYYLPELLMEYRRHPEQQGIHRAIPYLTDKLYYLDSYQFESELLETVRQNRLMETKLLLGLRLVEVGETAKGRQLLWEVKSVSPKKAWTGLVLSGVPRGWRRGVFQWLRQWQKS